MTMPKIWGKLMNQGKSTAWLKPPWMEELKLHKWEFNREICIEIWVQIYGWFYLKEFVHIPSLQMGWWSTVLTWYSDEGRRRYSQLTHGFDGLQTARPVIYVWWTCCFSALFWVLPNTVIIHFLATPFLTNTLNVNPDYIIIKTCLNNQAVYPPKNSYILPLKWYAPICSTA
jgi:hypothetical protein